MITPEYFKKACQDVLGKDNCEFSVEHGVDMRLMISCRYNNRVVAHLTVYSNMDSVVMMTEYGGYNKVHTVYCRWWLRHTLKKATYFDRNLNYNLTAIAKDIGNQLFQHKDDIKRLFEMIIYQAALMGKEQREIAMFLMDKADVHEYGQIKWRSKTHEQSQPNKEADNAKADH